MKITYIPSQIGFIEKYLSQAFFDSLRNDYQEFDTWYNKCIGDENKRGYYWVDEFDNVYAFIGLKIEKESIFLDGEKVADEKQRLKITTIKSDSGIIKSFSEFVIYLASKNAIKSNINEIYFSVIPDTPEKQKLVEISKKYGFSEIGHQNKTKDGIERKHPEIFLLKTLKYDKNASWFENYPLFEVSDKTGVVFIPFEPEFHDYYLQDAKLRYEVQNFDGTKMTIQKAYIHNQNKLFGTLKNDLVLFYRKKTETKMGALTGIGIIEKHYKKWKDYNNIDELEKIVKNYSALKIDQSLFDNNSYVTMFSLNATFGEGNNIPHRWLDQNNLWFMYKDRMTCGKQNLLKILEKGKLKYDYIITD